MKFAMSYSCGKDSTLALHKTMAEGHRPIALIVMVNEDAQRSFFHGADCNMLKSYEDALGIPMILAYTTGEDYHLKMEQALRRAREMGAEAACFGDIDIKANRAWCEDRCRAAGLAPLFPLWQAGREKNVTELIALGYKCLIKSINNVKLPKDLLGKIMDSETIDIMRSCGIDVCGENGEYHTLVMDGPIFRKPLNFKVGEVLDFGDYSVVDVK